MSDRLDLTICTGLVALPMLLVWIDSGNVTAVCQYLLGVGIGLAAMLASCDSRPEERS